MIVVGIILAVCASAIGTTSKQLIAASEHLKKPWLFHLGASMNIAVGPVVDASAYAFAPQVIVAPFACLDVIFNALTAPYTLHWQQERLTMSRAWGTALVAIGAALTSVFADATNTIYNVRELEAQLFLRPTSLAYLAIELCAILTVKVLLKKQLLNPAVRGISLGVIAGVLMGNVFFLKGLIGLIQTTASTGSFDAWLRPTPYVLAAAAAAGAVCGHLFMRKGLGEYKGVFMVTIFEGAHISAACLSGCIVMEEMAGAQWWRYVLYWLSVSTIVAGMLVINMAAADAQIEGKFHIAQSFKTLEPIPEDEDELFAIREKSPAEGPQSLVRSRSLRGERYGRPLEDHDVEAVGVMHTSSSGSDMALASWAPAASSVAPRDCDGGDDFGNDFGANVELELAETNGAGGHPAGASGVGAAFSGDLVVSGEPCGNGLGHHEF